MTGALEDPTLSSHVARGFRWSLLNNTVTRIGSFLTGVLLARLLVPHDYGVYAAALVVLNVLLSLNELGVSLAIVRWNRPMERFAPTVVTLAVASSCFAYALAWFSAPLVSSALGAPSATSVIRILALSVIVDGCACVPAAILTRNFLQRRRLFVDLANFTSGTALTILLAVGGLGAASLAWGRLLGNCVALALLVAWKITRVRPGFDRAVAAELVRFGLPLAGASLLVLGVVNVDYVIIGSVLGPVDLGYYLLATSVAAWPVSFFSEAIRRVSFAGFSRVADDDEAFSEGFARAAALVLAVIVPVGIGLAVVAEPLIELVYGSKWLPAASALKFLALLGIARVFLELAYDALIARGRATGVMAIQGSWLVCLVPALVLAASQGGIAGVGLVHATIAWLVIVPAFLWLLVRHGLRLREVALLCWRPMVGAPLLAVTAVWASHLAGGSALLSLLFAFLVGVAVYIPIVLPLRRLLPR
jgi:PST family polysaccharide transporter